MAITRTRTASTATKFKVEFRLIGIEKILRGLDMTQRGLQKAVMEAMDEHLDKIMKATDEDVPKVPVRTGALQSTIRKSGPMVKGKYILGSIKAGGVPSPAMVAALKKEYGPHKTKVDYAVVVHEDLTPRNWRRAGAGPKYLTSHAERRHWELLFGAQKKVDNFLRIAF